MNVASTFTEYVSNVYVQVMLFQTLLKVISGIFNVQQNSHRKNAHKIQGTACHYSNTVFKAMYAICIH